MKSALFAAALAAGVAFFASCADDTITIQDTTSSAEYDNIGKNNIYLRDGQTGTASNVVEVSVERGYTTTLQVGWSKAGSLTTPLQVQVDASYLEVYNQEHGTSYPLFPVDSVFFENGGIVTPDASKNRVELQMTVQPWADIESGQTYAIPVTVGLASSGTANAGAVNANHIGHCVYLVKGTDSYLEDVNKGEGLPKGFLFFEVNDANPLNAFAFKLENGKLLWDVVVLFAANINLDTETNAPKIHCNDNVQFLLDNNETYLQPLRKHGIKVLLGVLGNHDASGVAQLSDMGAKYFAEQVAFYCEKYNLDGVNYDDEYSKSPDLSNPYLARQGYERAARLCYESKQAMPDKLVTVFSYGYMGHTGFPEEIDGKPISQWLDIVVPNYGGRAYPHGDLTVKSCAYFAMEFNGGGDDLTTDNATAMKEGGYGWFMGFAPQPSNFPSAFNRLRQGGATVLWGSEVAEPTIYYKKDDPTPYPYEAEED